MTIYDISKKAGVSIATVSRVLNNSDSVRPSTRKKVMDIIEASGYTPNAFARGLGLNTMHAVGLLCADCSDMFLAKAVYYVERQLRTNGYECILCCSGYEHADKVEALSILIKKHVDSIILIGSNFLYPDDSMNEYIREAASQVPVMILNGDFDHPNVYCTFCDDYKASVEAVSSLINEGRTHILHLYDSDSFSGRKKLSGYQSALVEHDLPVEKMFMQKFTGNRESPVEIAQFLDSISTGGLTFDGVFASSDYLALGAIKYAKSKGLNVPEDVSIIGYNNSVLVGCSDPELTSVDNQLDQISTQLVSTLTSVLDGNSMPQKTVYSGTIIKRGTTTK